MPTSDEILGFANRWYEEAFQHAVNVTIDTDLTIRIFSSPYFIATKLEAFKDRGEGDGRFSSDFEDIVYVLNNRTTIWDDMNNATTHLRSYLKHEFQQLSINPYIDEWISSHLEHGEQHRVRNMKGNMEEFALINLDYPMI
jgi:predicted nucleotidyltransferase